MPEQLDAALRKLTDKEKSDAGFLAWFTAVMAAIAIGVDAVCSWVV